MSNRAYKKGQRVSGHVSGLGPNAVFVTLPDGTCGIVRQRELSWEPAVRHPDELVSRGEEIEVVVLEHDPHSERLELSLRLAQHDPWESFASSAQRGQIVHGIVTSIMPYGAFVEIEPGIVGLVHISEIAPWRVSRVEDLLWVGDHVEAIILRVERERRHVALSIKARMEQIAPARTRTFEKIDRSKLSTPPSEEESTYAPTGKPVRKIHTVLIADDEADLRQAMRDRMHRHGYQVEAVESGDAAVKAASERRFDVVFIDVHFSMGLDGVQAARRIASLRPGTVVVFMTGVELTEDRIDAIGDYQAAGPATLLLKPLRPEEIDEILVQIESDQLDSLDVGSWATGGAVSTWARPVRERHGPLSQQLANVLQTMHQQTKATAVVFHLDSETRDVRILAQVGDIPMDLKRARHHLADSPVGDVILGELILENDVKGPARGKFRHLLTLLNFSSCIGVPITVWDEVQHAVFFFHGNADHFSPLDQERALAVAWRLGAVLERSRLDERMEMFQRLSLQGQLTTALAHEVNNKLSTIEMDLDGVLQGFQSLIRQPGLKEGWTEICQDLERLTRLSRQTLDAVSLFQRLMRSDEPCVLDVNRVVHDVVEQLQPLARRNSMRLQEELSPQLPACWGLEPRLRQACHNIALNAIQQLGRKTATGGRVTVRTFHEPHDERPIKISFHDDGPGIHRRDFERVFDMGYSTRGQEGTGLGLYVTRGLIEAMGGRVCVAESYVLVGTTFLIELPAIEPAQHKPE
jgi:signal transduction histidine kinase/predicted RNA-binding protein with RPS1 domain/DNA-binding NarL/FixJ family response regulator